MRVPMKRMKLQCVAIMLLTASAHALDTAALLNDSGALELLGKKGIRVVTSGLVPVRFDAVSAVLSQPRLYQVLQDEYARSVAKSGTVEFPIVQTAPGHYCYVNEKNLRTDIVELYRRQTGEGVFDIVVNASGKRLFGGFDVLVHVQVLDAADAGVVYIADIRAYPRNGAKRFVARRFGMLERYFRKHTTDMLWVARKITVGMASNPGFSPTVKNEGSTFSPAYFSPPSLIPSGHSYKSGT